MLAGWLAGKSSKHKGGDSNHLVLAWPKQSLLVWRVKTNTLPPQRLCIPTVTKLPELAMERLTLKIAAISLFAFCITQVGCQSPGNPMESLSFGGQTRVPPPPTGAVGPGSGYQAPAPASPTAPPTFAPPNPNGLGTFQPINSAPPMAANDQFSNVSGTTTAPPVSGSSQLTRAENAAWGAPAAAGYQAAPTYNANVYAPVGSGQAQSMPPAPFPTPGSVAPINTASPRIRGFNSYGQQQVQIPPELSGYQTGPVQQANATGSNWQSR